MRKIPWPDELVISRNVSRGGVLVDYFACDSNNIDNDLADRDTVAIYQLNRIAVFRRTTELTPVPAKKSHKSRAGASPAGKK